VRVIEQRILRAARSAGLIAARRREQGGGGPHAESALVGAEPMQANIKPLRI